MPQKNYGLVKDEAQLSAFVDRLLQAGTAIGFDIETGYEGPDREGVALHPDDPDCKVVGISFTNSLDWARYVPLSHDLCAENFDPEPTAELFWKLLSSGLGVPHNAKFELRHLARWFRETLPDDHPCQATRGYYPVLSDTLIEAYILADQQSYGLKHLTKQKFGHEQAELLSLFPGLAKGKSKSIRFNVLDLTPEVVAYACEDSVWALALHQEQYPKVKDTFLYKVEMQVLPVLCGMEDYGVKWDWAAMREAAREARIFMDLMEEEIQAELSAMIGSRVQVNLGSPAQVANVLFTQLNMKPAGRTSTGAPSTDAKSLKALAAKHHVVQLMLEWKEVRTLLTRYLEKYEKDYSYAADGMSHPNHMQTAVASGRFAVSEPPYQQAPKYYKYELRSGKQFNLNFRNLIIAPPEHYLLGFDFSQVELRMMAGEAGEPTLLQAFDNDEDVHTATAALMLGIPRDQVTKEQRAIGKTSNFALLYGQGADALGASLGRSKEEGRELYAKYFSAFSAIRVWADKVTREGTKRGYSISKFGRKFTIWELQSPDSWIRSKGERLCVNAPIQGAAADYMKIAMVKQHAALKAAGLLDRVHLVMNIHDALEYYVHESVAPEDVVRVVAPAVTFPVAGLPKIVADWHTGPKWGSLTEWSWDGVRLVEKGGVKPPQPAPATVEPAVGGSGAALEPSVQEPLRERYAPDNKEAVETHAAAAQALPPPVQSDAPSQQLVVSISQMPDSDQYGRWLAMLSSTPGPHAVVLNTPEGTLDYEALRTGLTPDDQPRISLALGGATVKWAASSVDSSVFAAGIQL